MDIKRASVLAAASLGILLGARSASATANMFAPIAATNFTPLAYPAVSWRCDFGTQFGQCQNQGASAFAVEGSLGHALGGSNAFTVSGFGNGGTFDCSIMIMSTVSHTFAPAPSGSTSASGSFSFVITANPPSGNDYFYTMRCSIPPGGILVGVKPNN